MGVKLAPVGRKQFIDENGAPYSGAQVFYYIAGTTQKQDTFTTSAGTTANDNPLLLNSKGQPDNEIWFTEGISYKEVIAPSGDTDPPIAALETNDNLTGINDFTSSSDEWVASGLTPTYISATSFSLVGDVTSRYHIGRRLKTVNSGGTIYSTITATAYTSLTTITVVNDSGVLDSGISAVSYGILSSVNPSVPKIVLPDGSTATTQPAATNDATVATTSFVVDAIKSTQDFRLSLTTAAPVTTADVTAATTIYATPYKGNRIGLYDGSNWNQLETAEISLALGTITSDQGYDIFCYDNAGTATLELLAWTNKTTRATALAYQDGVLCKTGALTRRYLGSFLTTATTTTEDSAAKRYLFNYYHRVNRRMNRIDATTSWVYGTGTWRQANADSDNQLNVFVGVVEDVVNYSLTASALAGAGTGASNAIGLNSTSSVTGGASFSSGTSEEFVNMVSGSVYPILGYNYIAWLERASSSNTFYGTSTQRISELSGQVLA